MHKLNYVSLALIATFSLGLVGYGLFNTAQQNQPSHELVQVDFDSHAAYYTDWEAAKAEAKKSNRDIIIKFTGSDWCPPCIALWNNIFSKEAFQKGLEKDYVLMYVDRPRRKQLPEAETKQNAMLLQSYGVQSFPTVIMTTAEGLPYAYPARPATVDAYIAGVKEEQPKKEKLVSAISAAEKMEGLQQAKALDALLSEYKLPSDYQMKYAKLIVEADADNGAGLKSKYNFLLIANTMMTKVQSGSEFDILAEIATHEKDSGIKGENLQKLYLMSADYFYAKKNMDKLVMAIEKAIAADPEGRLTPQLEKGLERLKQQLGN